MTGQKISELYIRISVQEVRRDKGGTLRAEDYTSVYAKTGSSKSGIGRHALD
jgi:hypothetical protein